MGHPQLSPSLAEHERRTRRRFVERALLTGEPDGLRDD
jgi:hypothetical protein